MFNYSKKSLWEKVKHVAKIDGHEVIIPHKIQIHQRVPKQ